MPLLAKSFAFAVYVAVVACALQAGETAGSFRLRGDRGKDADDLFTSCDQCTVFAGALWCGASFRCHYYNETPPEAEGRRSLRRVPPPGTSSAADCAAQCGGAACLDFLSCFFGAASCGECMYLGGAWCQATMQCYPRNLNASARSGGGGGGDAWSGRDAETDDEDEATFSCEAHCGGLQQHCATRDEQCPPCDRYNAPLRCSRTLPVLIVSVVSTAAFLVALCLTLFTAHTNRGKFVGPDAHIGPITGNIVDSPISPRATKSGMDEK